MSDLKQRLLIPQRLWSREEVLLRPCPIQKIPGVYAWYFKNIPSSIPTEDCIKYGAYALLYIGISPKAPPQNGKKPSSQTLFNRLRYHYRGNAEGSTLRLTLGCLLNNTLSIELRRVGSGNRLTFAKGEATLSEWMSENSFITWVEHPKPWELEEELISEYSLPLNLDKNQHHPFYPTLKKIRHDAKDKARKLPVIN